jgi:nicotinamide phosphoribosyltransferase
MKFDPIAAIDFYKADHRRQYPEGTEVVYSNFTPRSGRLAAKSGTRADNGVVFFGLNGFIKWFLIDGFNENFFKQPKEKVLAKYQKRMNDSLVTSDFDVSHIAALHDLGYLPLEIRALPEGTFVPYKVPMFTIHNTMPEFFWLTNYIESVISSEIWKACTSATTALQYRLILQEYAVKTGSPLDFVLWQGHDFSFRGQSGLHDASSSGAGHLLSFLGTDTIPAIDYLENYYNGLDTFVGGSVPASEHSVASSSILAFEKEFASSANPKLDSEIKFFKHYITNVYPSGVASYVADTYNFWDVISVIAAKCKPEIMARTPNALGLAKVVFRPDSGDPVDVLTGIDFTDYSNENCRNDSKLERAAFYNGDAVIKYPNGEYWEVEHEVEDSYGDYFYEKTTKIRQLREVEVKGAVETLWDIFGGTITETGHKLLDSHVGLIYGDSITIERAKKIMQRLEAKGFASANVVFGIGSYTYQYVTRDTHGFAVKSTYGVINGEPVEIFKDPVTDSGVKKSAKGLLQVLSDNGQLILRDQVTPEESEYSLLRPVFFNGNLIADESLASIRQRIENFVKG